MDFIWFCMYFVCLIFFLIENLLSCTLIEKKKKKKNKHILTLFFSHDRPEWTTHLGNGCGREPPYQWRHLSEHRPEASPRLQHPVPVQRSWPQTIARSECLTPHALDRFLFFSFFTFCRHSGDNLRKHSLIVYYGSSTVKFFFFFFSVYAWK